MADLSSPADPDSSSVETPWGASDSLRGHRLSPGPGTPPGKVAANQRKRLFAALVASVGERGYAATRVSDLVELAGVSSRSFYDLFPDRRACLLAALEEIVPAVVEIALGQADAADADGDWEEQSRQALAGLAATVISQPATARLCLVESFTAGAEASAVVDAGIARSEGLIAERLARSPQRAAMPEPLITALIGGLLEFSRMQLLRGEEQELPDLLAGAADFLLDYRPPTGPLRQGGRRRRSAPEVLAAHTHAERGLRALEALVAEQGYPETTMEQVAKRAGMSAKTLYANFDGKEDLLLAAIDSGGAQIVAAAMPAFRRGSTWSEGFRGALSSLLSLLAARPELARLMLVEVYAGGGVAVQRRAEVFAPFRSLLGEGPRALPPTAVELIISGIVALCRKQVLDHGAETLPRLLPICAYIALAPSLGAEAATAAASGKVLEHVKRAQSEQAIVGGVSESAAWQVLGLAQRSPRTAAEVAAALEMPLEVAAARLEELRGFGILEAEESGPDPGSPLIYRFIQSIADTEEWAQLDPARRRAISGEIIANVKAEIEQAVAADTFDSRTDRHLSRVALWLDEQGWGELDDLFEVTLDTTLEIQRRSSERQQDGDAPGISARAVFMLFEMPPP